MNATLRLNKQLTHACRAVPCCAVLCAVTCPAFELVLEPIISEFDPQLVIISAGFDAAEGDFLGK
jgi:hypothetical protein